MSDDSRRDTSSSADMARRAALATIAATGIGVAAASGSAAAARPRTDARPSAPGASLVMTLTPRPGDMTGLLQAAIDRAADASIPLLLAPGRFAVRGLALRTGLDLRGSGRATRIDVTTPDGALAGENSDGIRLSCLTITGSRTTGRSDGQQGLVRIRDSSEVLIEDISILAAPATALALARCGGRISRVRVRAAGSAAIFSIDSAGLAIADNDIADCADNGILVWTSKPAVDRTIVSGNRIARIGAASGGSGQFGNGINVFRAGSVIVSGNHITDCAYTAVRGNAASNIQITANTCERLGEVALYSEFGFEGALIQGNIVDRAACGISVTNFNEGGRLAVIQGNLVRNLFRREHEPQDKRGEGIAVEADASITGNTIENAPTAGIVIGWGRYMRNVAATGNVIRNAGIGIAVSSDAQAGTALVASNLIAGAARGAVRAMRLAEPVGPDLAAAPQSSVGRIIVQANAVA
ncbi:MAG: TIGR03808 family TAT-translocated repetitive protein [Hyphomicrobiaceae bacterium]